ncbi:hypothetical protein AMJ40_05010 [candidate division TA06 bacterium DG_26]|uniref:Cyanophycin synthase-like N-terminal domain-containing protein n=1 Tax=candidate division TA06 bacterium DG_26 TaxID=1703771 RepID=A0A0S7WHM4_UNCT6|nr:MAG: hypothetical protein AMJ40_05010 [candidate division TA06 bacterium DG_26]
MNLFNPKFASGSHKLKVALEMDGWESPHPSVGVLIDKLVVLFPTLKEHKCNWEYLSMNGSSAHEDELRKGIQEFGGYEDIAHLVEHLIIDLQHSVAGMRLCSGVTCCYEDLFDKYDIFVECPSRKTGRFAAFLAVEVLSRFLTEGQLDEEYRKVIEFARYLLKHPDVKIAREGLTPDARKILGTLIRFNFLPLNVLF